MTHEQFVVWLHGFFEISDAKTLNEKQTQVIKDHLDLFFDKQTPDRTVEEVINFPSVWDTPVFPVQDIYWNGMGSCTCNIGAVSTCPVHGINFLNQIIC